MANNIFGVHVADAGGLPDVAKLVNSNGGDWGYVTFVIQKGDRDPKRWQAVFDKMRELHLIPIVRIATAPIAGNSNEWEIPNTGEIDGWVSFLNSLNWVIKNRYVIIGNEPNHASEWGGQIDPAGYAIYLKNLSSKLKSSNDDFFVMAAGFDASAGNTRDSMEESLYLDKMLQADSGAFNYIDGWASHSYPNPAFSGPGDASGKGSVRSYDWELNYLKFLGVQKELPVFITETGWVHDTNLTTNIGPKIETAFKNVWEKDSRVVAVTPFIFKYIDPPFDTFSWQNKAGQPYDFYYNILNLAKTKGAPVQDDKADLLTGIFPRIATVNSIYHGVLIIKNLGESIWNHDNLAFANANKESYVIESMYPGVIEPGQIGIFLVRGEYPSFGGNYLINIGISRDGKIFNEQFITDTNIIPNVPTLAEILDYLKVALAKKLSGH